MTAAQVWNEKVRQLAPGKSFVDVGALWNIRNEKISVAGQAGASHLAIADISPTDSMWWDRMASHLHQYDYDAIIVDATAPNAPELIGQHDIVHCSGVIYHQPDPMQLLLNLRRCTNETLVLGSMVIPDILETKHGILDSTSTPVFVPALEGRTKKIVAAHYGRIGLTVGGVSGPAPSSWSHPDRVPWWWLLSPSVIRSMVEASSFRVVDEFWTWEDRAFAVVAEAV